MEPEELMQATLDAIIESQNDFMRMSNGYWLDIAPEYFLTTSIAKRLADPAQGIYSSLEEPMASFNFGRGRRNHGLRFTGKADVAIWDRDENPVGIVEVKKQVSTWFCQSDLDRLALFSMRAPQGCIGCFGYFFIESRPTVKGVTQSLETLDQRLCELGSDFAERYGVDFVSTNLVHEPENDGTFYSGWLAHASVFVSR